MFDGELFGEQMVEVVKGYFEREVSPLLAQISSLKDEVATLKQGMGTGLDEQAVRSLVAAAQLAAGKDAVGLAGALIDRAGNLVVTLSDGTTRELGQVTGRDACPDLMRSMVANAVTAAVEALPAPVDGKDADPEAIRLLVNEEVARAVEALPAPTDGKDADPEAIRLMVADAVAAAVGALPAPADGKDADPDVIRQIVSEEVARAVEALPAPLDGKDVDPAVVRLLVGEEVARAVEALPAPRDGKDADPETIQQMVSDAFAQVPIPRDGKDVDPTEIRAMIDEAVAGLPSPRDGVGLAGALIDRSGALVVTLSDGTTRELGPVVGKDADMPAILTAIETAVGNLPKATDGIDGFGFDDLTVEQSGERSFVFRFAQGERVKEFAFDLPVILDRGVFKEGQPYEQGDGVTWGGSFWIAQRNTAAKPGEGDDWRLAVKRGRDGRDKTA